MNNYSKKKRGGGKKDEKHLAGDLKMICRPLFQMLLALTYTAREIFNFSPFQIFRTQGYWEKTGAHILVILFFFFLIGFSKIQF